MRLTVDSDIPVGRGLGSSAAAFAAGALAAWRTAGVEPEPGKTVSPRRRASRVTPTTPRPQFSVVCRSVDVVGAAHRLTLHPGFCLVVAVPDAILFTNDARAVLPASFSREIVVRSLQRAVALIEGLRSGQPELLMAAGDDEIHERPRSALNPAATLLIETSPHRRSGLCLLVGRRPFSAGFGLRFPTGRSCRSHGVRSRRPRRGLTPEIAVAGIL